VTQLQCSLNYNRILTKSRLQSERIALRISIFAALKSKLLGIRVKLYHIGQRNHDTMLGHVPLMRENTENIGRFSRGINLASAVVKLIKWMQVLALEYFKYVIHFQAISQ
jgi:hypothetical protein